MCTTSVLDGEFSDFNSEISLVHLATLQQKVFADCPKLPASKFFQWALDQMDT